VFSVPPWWKTAENTYHKDAENTEDAQRFGNQDTTQLQLSLDFSWSVGYLLCAKTYLTGLRALTQHLFAVFYREFQVHS